MSAFEELMNDIRSGKSSDIQKAIVYHLEARRVIYDQEKAAAELARLQAIAAAAEKMANVLQWIYDDGEGGSNRPDIQAALVGYDKIKPDTK
jgi:hypothetical protein